MADGEFIGPGGIVRQTIITAGDHGQATVINAAPGTQWATIKQGTTTQNFYPASAYEWKVDDPLTIHQPLTTAKKGKKVTVTMAPADIKPLPQAIIAQCSNAWSSGNTVVTGSSEVVNYQTIKLEQAMKPTTINTAGLHFISAPATATVTQAPQPNMNVVIHGGRKTGTIIETFKCEVCNQIYSSMNALQNHVAQVHEVGLNKGQGGRKTGFNSSTLLCEYKYSGLSLADSITGMANNANQQHQPQIIATTGNYGQHHPQQAYIQAPANLSITSLSTIPSSPGIVVTKHGKVRKEKRRNWQCELCHNRFSRKDHLAKHVSAVHEKIRPFECMNCNQKFSQKHHLRAHMLARHEDDKAAAKAFACQLCPKRFTRNDHLERHIESVHEKRKAFECAVCAHQFARKHHLSKHILAVHAKVKPYGCNQCDQSFLQRHHLGAHIMSVHQPPIHEEADGTKSYVCAICQHRFKRKDHLKKHVETVHEKTRAYACMLCERRFGQKYHLAIHVSAVHEGKKPYACDLCSHKSARKSGLQRHMRTVHNVKNPHIASQPLQLTQAHPTLTLSSGQEVTVQDHNAMEQTVTYTVTTQ